VLKVTATIVKTKLGVFIVIIWAVFASIMHITLLCFPFYPEV
jgi:hypothetical protein